ncbi:MAG: YopX family protein [Gemella haemolysans]|uniref:YopX family protein n=1 Tax=Gemella haemolysans TaxID=1379 RepID=UPI003F9ECB62
MKRPKIYVERYNKVFDVQEIHFDIDVVCFDNGQPDFAQFEFEDVEFIYNTGYRDKNDNYIYTGDILEYQGEANIYYIRKLLVEKDGEEESYILTTNGIYVRRLMDTDDYLVIGNIYENKELLED